MTQDDVASVILRRPSRSPQQPAARRTPRQHPAWWRSQGPSPLPTSGCQVAILAAVFEDRGDAVAEPVSGRSLSATGARGERQGDGRD